MATRGDFSFPNALSPLAFLPCNSDLRHAPGFGIWRKILPGQSLSCTCMLTSWIGIFRIRNDGHPDRKAGEPCACPFCVLPARAMPPTAVTAIGCYSAAVVSRLGAGALPGDGRAGASAQPLPSYNSTPIAPTISAAGASDLLCSPRKLGCYPLCLFPDIHYRRDARAILWRTNSFLFRLTHWPGNPTRTWCSRPGRRTARQPWLPCIVVI